MVVVYSSSYVPYIKEKCWKSVKHLKVYQCSDSTKIYFSKVSAIAIYKKLLPWKRLSTFSTYIACDRQDKHLYKMWCHLHSNESF